MHNRAPCPDSRTPALCPKERASILDVVLFFWWFSVALLFMCRSNVVRASPRLASAGAARAVFTLGVAGAAATTTAAGGATVAVTGGVVLALDHDAVVVAVVTVNEEGEELRGELSAKVS